MRFYLGSLFTIPGPSSQGLNFKIYTATMDLRGVLQIFAEFCMEMKIWIREKTVLCLPEKAKLLLATAAAVVGRG